MLHIFLMIKNFPPGSLLTLFAVLLFAGCTSYTGETLPQSGQHPGVLAPGDTIKVSFTTAPELNTSEKIGTNGMVSLPLIGDVHAAGKTTAAFQADLTARYKDQ